MIPVQLTFFPVPTFLSAALHVPLALTVSSDIVPLRVNAPVIVAFPLYVLFVQLDKLAVTLFAVIFAVAVLLVALNV